MGPALALLLLVGCSENETGWAGREYVCESLEPPPSFLQHPRDAHLWLQIQPPHGHRRHGPRQEELWLPAVGHRHGVPGEPQPVSTGVCRFLEVAPASESPGKSSSLQGGPSTPASSGQSAAALAMRARCPSWCVHSCPKALGLGFFPETVSSWVLWLWGWDCQASSEGVLVTGERVSGQECVMQALRVWADQAAGRARCVCVCARARACVCTHAHALGSVAMLQPRPWYARTLGVHECVGENAVGVYGLLPACS